MATYGRRSHVYILFLQIRLFVLCFVLWLPILVHRFSAMRKIMAIEVHYIFYSYTFGLYFISLISMISKHNHRCHWKEILCLCYLAWTHIYIYIYIWYVQSGPKFNATISQDICYILRLYLSSSHMCKLSNYFKDVKVLESIGIISIQDSLDWVESEMNLNTIYYLKFHTCKSGFLSILQYM